MAQRVDVRVAVAVVVDSDEVLGEAHRTQPDVGIVVLGHPEFGSVSLSELEAVRGKLNLPVERDLYFTATKTLSAYADEARAHGAITE